MRALLQKDYVLLSLHSQEHVGGAQLIAKLRQGHAGGGIPWMTVLDASGKELVTGDGPKGNVGCPARPHEIAWFRTMLERTRHRLTAAELDTIQQQNEAFAERWLGKTKG
ncbi:MAG TPA: hypothetical protein VFZ65_20160 [Planctomycetota bacterium]|nr:hypothetical protein [Planctomycetota bacterium]